MICVADIGGLRKRHVWFYMRPTLVNAWFAYAFSICNSRFATLPRRCGRRLAIDVEQNPLKTCVVPGWDFVLLQAFPFWDAVVCAAARLDLLRAPLLSCVFGHPSQPIPMRHIQLGVLIALDIGPCRGFHFQFVDFGIDHTSVCLGRTRFMWEKQRSHRNSFSNPAIFSTSICFERWFASQCVSCDSTGTMMCHSILMQSCAYPCVVSRPSSHFERSGGARARRRGMNPLTNDMSRLVIWHGSANAKLFVSM